MQIKTSTIQVSKKAKEYALNIIDFHGMPNTHKLGFWLGIPLESDYIALAVYVDQCLKNDMVTSPYGVVELLRDELPAGWHFL